MGGFYSSPRAKPLYPVFQLAMIASDYDENGEKTDEGCIARLVPTLLKKRDGSGRADQKNSQPPSCESDAGSSRTMQEPVDSQHEPNERSISVWVGL